MVPPTRYRYKASCFVLTAERKEAIFHMHVDSANTEENIETKPIQMLICIDAAPTVYTSPP